MVSLLKTGMIGSLGIAGIAGIVANIIGLIIVYRVLTLQNVVTQDPKILDLVSLLKKCALGAFVCLVSAGVSPAFFAATRFVVLILGLVMSISLLKISEAEMSFSGDLLFLRKMALIYTICFAISVGMAFVTGGAAFAYRKMQM